jgi:hypothetical protein
MAILIESVEIIVNTQTAQRIAVSYLLEWGIDELDVPVSTTLSKCVCVYVCVCVCCVCVCMLCVCVCVRERDIRSEANMMKTEN